VLLDRRAHSMPFTEIWFQNAVAVCCFYALRVLGDVTFAKHALSVVYFTVCVVAYSMRSMRDFPSVIMRYRKKTLLVCKFL